MDYICKDGVVLAESAMNMAGATIDETITGNKDDFVLYGNIHQQMRNSKELKEKLEGKRDELTGALIGRGLYLGSYGDHFQLD